MGVLQFGRWGVIAVALIAFVMVTASSAKVAFSSAVPAMIEMQKVDPEDGTAPTVFPHWKHQRAFGCYACHPTLFSTYKKSTGTHKAMRRGKFCGACHDGILTFAHNSRDVECEVCHAESK